MNTRHLASNILQYSGANAIAMAVRRNSLAVLCYHRVLDPGDPVRASVDPALVTSSHVFQRQMEIISRQFNPLTLSDTLRCLQGDRPLPSRAVLITFDDGVVDSFTNAFPIMRRLGIPGVIFLATGFIGTSQRYWTDVVHERVAVHLGARRASEEVERLKGMPSSRRQDLLTGLIDAPEPASPGATPNLTWRQVEEMGNHGFEFGSHTRNHVILTHESDAEVSEELQAASGDLRLRLGHSPVAFAYPDGQYDSRTTDLVRESGCQLAFTCDEGFASKRSCPHALPRLLVHDGISATADGRFSRAMFLTYLAGTIPRRYRRTTQ